MEVFFLITRGSAPAFNNMSSLGCRLIFVFPLPDPLYVSFQHNLISACFRVTSTSKIAKFVPVSHSVYTVFMKFNVADLCSFVLPIIGCLKNIIGFTAI